MVKDDYSSYSSYIRKGIEQGKPHRRRISLGKDPSTRAKIFWLILIILIIICFYYGNSLGLTALGIGINFLGWFLAIILVVSFCSATG